MSVKKLTHAERNVKLGAYGDEWCDKCHAYAATRGRSPSDNSDGDDAYWQAYNEKWDELCPEFNPMNGRGYD